MALALVAGGAARREEPIPDTPSTAQDLQKKGADALEAGDAATALEYLSRSLDAHERAGSGPEDLAETHALLAACRYMLKDLPMARRHQEQAIAYRRRLSWEDPGVFENALDDLYNLGFLALNLEDLPAARDAWSERLRLLLGMKEPNHGTAVAARSDLAEVERRLGNYGTAERLMQETVQESEAHLPADHVHAVYLNNLGALYWDEGRYDEAERLYREALWLSEGDPETGPLRIAHAYENLGVLKRDQDQPEEAEQLLVKGLGLARASLEPGDPTLVTFLEGLAGVHARLRQWGDALALWEEALRILESASPRQSLVLARILYRMGRGQLAQDHPEEAEALLERSRALREHGLDANHPDLGTTYVALGRCKLHSQGPASPEVRRLVDRGVEILSGSTAEPEARAEAHALRAEILHAAGETAAARESLEEALKIVEELRPQRGGTDFSRAGFMEEYLGYYQRMVRWLVEAGDPEAALATAERTRARVLRDQLQAGKVDLRRGIPAERLAPLEARLTEARARINQAQRELNALDSEGTEEGGRAPARARLENELRAALQAHQDAIGELRLSSPEWRDLLRDADTEVDVSKVGEELLNEGTLLLAYHVGPEASFLFVLRPGRPLECQELRIPPGPAALLGVPPGPLSESVLDRLLSGGAEGTLGLASVLRGQRVTPGNAAFPRTEDRLHVLWQVLIPESLRKDLLAAREAIVIPDAALHLLPFEALVVEPGAKGECRYWLDAGPPIRYAHGLRVLLELERQPPSAAAIPVLTLSNPVFAPSAPAETSALRGRSLAPLPGTRLESEALLSLYPRGQVISLQGAEAREEAFKLLAPKARLLHVATHGIVSQDQNGLLAALAFTAPAPGADADGEEDGFLHLFELYDMVLDAELAVLSACETELGRQVRGEGVFALSRGFLAAGCRRTVASLWPVADASTALLMAEFFRGIREQEERSEPVEYARLLRDAKRALRSRPEWQDPYYWAPFVLSGRR